jgi:hypothetical protein
MDQIISSEERTISFVIQERRSQREGEDLPTYAAIARIYIDHEQVGCVSSAELRVSTSTATPEVVVRFLEGMPPDVVEAVSSGMKQSIRGWVEKLQKFAFVRVESPLKPL